MDDLLFLVHRIPYPPNKGDKIRSFHLLKYLSQHYRIHLATFVDQMQDQQYCDVVRQYCTTAWFDLLSPRRAKLKSLTGLFTGEALTLPYYRQKQLSQWIYQQCAQYQIKRVLVYSSAMAQYVLAKEFSTMRRVIDFVDVDSEKWRQYSVVKSFPMNWIYQHEAQRLGEFERMVAQLFDASVFVSEAEVQLFQKQFQQKAPSIYAITNGVDADYFKPDVHYLSPFSSTHPKLVFTGAMDYWANVEGAEWFAHHVLPLVQQKIPTCEFYIVGMNPTSTVKNLEQLPGVTVTGTVLDVRPYLYHANAVVVPLRIARGIQNKVLEAMAMARPVLATPQALEGIPAVIGEDVYVAAEALEFAEQTIQILNSDHAAVGMAARRFVETHFSWAASLPTMMQLLEATP